MAYKLTNIRFDDAQIDNMLHGPTGAVGRYMARKAIEHVAASKALSGKSSGRLANSISWDRRRLKRSQRIIITADVSYAFYHHEGTNPHTIYAKRGGSLKFISRGRVVRVSSVRHPGTKPNPFLTAPTRPVWGR